MQYGLIGEKLGHSFSKEIHESIGGEYRLCELQADELCEFMSKRDFEGINVTIPYKQKVIPLLDELSQDAEEIGAVNTVVCRSGRLCGYNTDIDGLAGLIKRVIPIGCAEGKKVLILGTGGTSLTAIAAARQLDFGEIVRVSRVGKGDDTVSYSEAEEKHSDAAMIINCTPLGMYPSLYDEPRLDLSKFGGLIGVVDCVYNPLRTRLVLEAQGRGISAQGGLFMLVAQAVRAHELFAFERYDDELCDKIYRDMLLNRENIVLIGMPSCGKSSVGKRLAQLLSRSFVDTDEEIVRREGREITEIFSEKGEKYFRELESRVVSELSARAEGLIIATGGGAVLNPENVKMLKANGRLFFIDRSLELLTPTASRPLSSDADAMAEKYNVRYPIYSAVCDKRINGDGGVNEVAELILSAIRE